MRVVKSEPVQLVDRQLAFFELVDTGPRAIQRLSFDSYSYDFLPGVHPTEPREVYEYLRTSVWCLDQLPHDATGHADHYALYVEGLWEQLGFGRRLPTGVYDSLVTMGHQMALVHGDATLENFIRDQSGRIVAIDPGLPRGFCHPENDVGKLCQSWLTHWSAVRHGTEPLPYRDPGFDVTGHTIASLVSHWIRILKNADRHPARVGRYGRKVALPVLLRELEVRAGRTLRSGWDAGALRRLHRELLPTGVQLGAGDGTEPGAGHGIGVGETAGSVGGGTGSGTEERGGGAGREGAAAEPAPLAFPC